MFQNANIMVNPQHPQIAIYRILGNDLPPRHKKGQTYNNLKFILQNEPTFLNCKKKWILNRIIDFEYERKILALLERYRQSYIHIPFSLREYRAYVKNRKLKLKIPREQLEFVGSRNKYKKILYITNINAARNIALKDGGKTADWILPLDGSCCFTVRAWGALLKRISIQKKKDKCFIIPMYRLTDNKQYFNFNIDRHYETEPQVIIGKHSTIKFNESYYYGYLSKIELLKRTGYRSRYTENGLIIVEPKYRCAYVVRLFSGVRKGEESAFNRMILREKAIDLILQELDRFCSIR